MDPLDLDNSPSEIITIPELDESPVTQEEEYENMDIELRLDDIKDYILYEFDYTHYHVANLIGRSSDIYSRNIYIDAGSNQGIRNDSIVIGKNMN